jgi:hypothetical protein
MVSTSAGAAGRGAASGGTGCCFQLYLVTDF